MPTETRGNYCFSPGRHRIGVESGERIHRHTVRDYIDLEFKPGRQYLLHGNVRNSGIAFQLIDVTREPQIVAAEFEINFKLESKQNNATQIDPSVAK